MRAFVDAVAVIGQGVDRNTSALHHGRRALFGAIFRGTCEYKRDLQCSSSEMRCFHLEKFYSTKGAIYKKGKLRREDVAARLDVIPPALLQLDQSPSACFGVINIFWDAGDANGVRD